MTNARPAHRRRTASPAMTERQDRRFFAPLFGILLVVVLPIVTIIAGADAARGASMPLTKGTGASIVQSVTVTGTGDSADVQRDDMIVTPSPAEPSPVDVPAIDPPTFGDVPSPDAAETLPAFTGLVLPYCATEDATASDAGPCYWDATVLGNGEGRSFVAVDGTFYYLP